MNTGHDDLTTIHIGPTGPRPTVPITPPADPDQRAHWDEMAAIRSAANLSTVVGEDNLIDAQPSPPNTVVRYLDMVAIGRMFGVSGDTVGVWRTRYADTHPFPAPDAVIGRTAGWAPVREDEIRQWEAGRPGRGAGGGRPRKG